MSLDTLINRARADFIEMPRLELTLPQAARLWSVGVDDCRVAIDVLVESGFVMWTVRSTIVRTSRDLPAGQRLPSYIDVQSAPNRDKAV
jgi:hypothetical protein